MEAADAAAQPDFLSREKIRELLEKGGESKRTDIGLLWRFFEQTAWRAGLPYVIHCHTCGPVQVNTRCSGRMTPHHGIAGLYPGSLVRLYPRFMQSNFLGIGPRLHELMGRLVREFQQE